MDEINLSKLPTVLYPRDLNQLSASEEDELDNYQRETQKTKKRLKKAPLRRLVISHGHTQRRIEEQVRKQPLNDLVNATFEGDISKLEGLVTVSVVFPRERLHTPS